MRECLHTRRKRLGMQTKSKRHLIILVNVAVMLGIIGFVLLHVQRAASESINDEVAQFETATDTMGQARGRAKYLQRLGALHQQRAYDH